MHNSKTNADLTKNPKKFLLHKLAEEIFGCGSSSIGVLWCCVVLVPTNFIGCNNLCVNARSCRVRFSNSRYYLIQHFRQYKR